MGIQAWPRSRERLREFLEVLPRLGGESLREWAQAYAEGQGVDRIAWDVGYLSAHHAFTSCLNVGGAPYIFEYFLRKQRPDVRLETVDLDVARFPHVEQVLSLKVHAVDIEQDPAALAALGRFDCVVFCEVIEHLRLDLLRTLAALRETLAPDGVLYLTTPNGVSLGSMKRFVLGRRSGPDPVTEWSKLDKLGHMGHVREYSMAETCTLLEAAGLTIERKFYRFGLRRPEEKGARWRNAAQKLLCTIMPSLANELVVTARRKPG